MLYAIFFNDWLRIASTIKRSAEDLCKLFIEASNAERLEANVLFEDLFDLVADNLNLLLSIFLHIAADDRLFRHFSECLADVLSERLNFGHFDLQDELAVAQD